MIGISMLIIQLVARTKVEIVIFGAFNSSGYRRKNTIGDSLTGNPSISRKLLFGTRMHVFKHVLMHEKIEFG